MSIRNWFAADTFLKDGRNKSDRPLPGKATRLIRHSDNGIAVRYWATDIVIFHPDGRIIINAGGWNTVTTRRKMNDYLPRGVQVYSEKGTMKIGVGTPNSGWYDRPTYVYGDDPVTLIPQPDGTWTVDGAGDESIFKANLKLAKAIGKYAEGYAAALVAGEIEAPSGGDCWMCSMGMPDGGEHLRSHMDEKYYVPSLIWKAMKDMGGSRMMHTYVAIAQRMPIPGWNEQPDMVSAYEAELLTRDVKSTLRRYMRRELGLG